MERSIMMHEAKFIEVSNKNLRDMSAYDCWAEARSGMEWAQLCKASKGPHGLSPTYVDYEYRWVPVFVLGFNQLSQKFLVQIESTGQKKEVKRLSIQFY